MAESDELFQRVCTSAGVHTSHADAFGQAAAPSPDALRAILSDFGIAEDPREALARFAAERDRLAPRLFVLEADAPGLMPLRRVGAHDEIDCELVLDDGTGRQWRVPALEGPALPLPPLPPGYHRLELRSGALRARTTLIAAPARCHQPAALEGGARRWGVAAQVYGLRSASSQGIGDFSDVARLCEGAAGMGASFAGLSPSHALFQANRSWISPYSPSSRLFLDPIYLDLNAIDGIAAAPAAIVLGNHAAMLAALARASLLDQRAIWAVKLPVLEALWERERYFLTPAFASFRQAQGEPLRRFAVFEALFEHFAAAGQMWLANWPREYLDPRAPAVVRFAAMHEDRINFHTWLQFLCDQQLGEAARRARQAGMAIGLYRDLAVGSDRGGADVWSQPQAYAPTLSIGAPPDRLAPQGQNWGLPPLDPLHLARSDLAAFRAPIVANMRHAGALRIDHAFQLARLFLIPQGAAAGDGAYVDYPFEAMLAVLRIESHRARCAVIAEDLGTAPPGFARRLRDNGIFSSCVVPFEREHDGGFRAPRHYPREALAMAATHDLPTFAGWWQGADLDLRHELGIFDFVETLGFHAARRREIGEFAKALHREGLLASDAPPEKPPLEAGAAFLARSNAALVAVQLEDAAGQVEQANLPGTVEGHPNWQRRLAPDLDALLAPGGGLAKLAGVMAREGRG